MEIASTRTPLSTTTDTLTHAVQYAAKTVTLTASAYEDDPERALPQALLYNAAVRPRKRPSGMIPEGLLPAARPTGVEPVTF
ncbi:hypothetical protein GCM10022224_057050 [Nonomuraea antimicrobica]|uniref:Uncharacterized protein n=1 Tax=Nonomuraea antimicrobica TaxID=561173 RepID=A0ABP7CDF6_9ACTN